MELLLLTLAGLGGLALLLQSKALPSKDDAEKAFGVLDKDPTDPDANTIFGKYKAFVQGDYAAAMPYLIHSKDTTLKTLAEHELDDKNTATPTQKVGMGDEWIAATKKFPALNRIFLDRASQWYVAAWPGLDGLWKDKAREQGAKMAFARPAGVTKKGVPKKWNVGDVNAVIQPLIDGTVARTGSHSIKLAGADPKISTSENGFQSDVIQFSGKEVEYSAFVRTDKTERKDDEVLISFFDNTGGLVLISAENMPTDVPFWNRVYKKIKSPANAVSLRVGAKVRSKNGAAWVDDMSVKVDGKEVLPNPSFEER